MHVKELVPRVAGLAVKAVGILRRHKRASIAVAAALLLVGPLLLTGDRDLVCLNAVGLGFGVLLLRRYLVRGSVRRPYRR